MSRLEFFGPRYAFFGKSGSHTLVSFSKFVTFRIIKLIGTGNVYIYQTAF